MKVAEQKNTRHDKVMMAGKLILMLVSVLLFLLSIDLMSSTLRESGQRVIELLFSATANPFIALFIGLLLTAIIQSSSTTTAMTVVLVGSGALSLTAAVPIIMGANIGTTLTSAIVSLGFIASKREFRKAISAGIIHDFFNIILTVILFPLEYYYQVLSRFSVLLATGLSSVTFEGDVSESTGFVLSQSAGAYIVHLVDNNWILLLLSILLLFATIKVMSKLIYGSLIGESKDKLQTYIFSNPFRSFGWGSGITAAVQSSSITTSLIIPFVATGRVSLQKAFPFIIGANLGTTITALIAALSKSEAAVSIALVHFLFNFFGVLLFLPFASIRKIPVKMATRFGYLTQANRLWAFVYIMLMFFVIPFILIYFYQSNHILR